jgi:hypothetical protein
MLDIPAEARPHSLDPLDWIIQHVCAADLTDAPVSADPYDGCPSGSHERRMKVGDPMPYYRHDQPGANGNHPLGFQRRDAYPLIDRHYGGIVSANDFNFDYSEPYGQMHPGDGDGYDVYRVANGYVTGGDTRDGGGYSSSFFGADCKPFGGWVLFPVSFLHSLQPGAQGRAVVPIHGEYWEQDGEPWPGHCEPGKGFSLTTLTTWSFEPAHQFGGVHGARTKTMDAVVSTHGLPNPPNSQPQFHLERLLFTDMYGATRWETWVQTREHQPATNDCGGPTQMTYEGIDFTLTACRDSSLTEVNSPPRPHAPWPYPESNVLADWHFTNAILPPWRIEEVKPEAGTFKITLGNSNTPLDTRLARGRAGVRYIQIDCSNQGPDHIGSLFQDVALSKNTAARTYDFGISGVIAGAGEGLVDVSLSQIDAKGRELAKSSLTAHFTNKYRDKTAAESVFRSSSVFLATSSSFNARPDAVSMRLTIQPKTPQKYDIIDAWVMPR